MSTRKKSRAADPAPPAQESDAASADEDVLSLDALAGDDEAPPIAPPATDEERDVVSATTEQMDEPIAEVSPDEADAPYEDPEVVAAREAELDRKELEEAARRFGVTPPDPASEAAESTYARTVDGTLDLRGERVDAAFDRIDKFIDDSLLASREVICLLHGHGTGALRAAVREHCNAHPMVAKLRPGTPPEGGDGVTLVWLG